MMQIVVALYIEAFEQFHMIMQNKQDLANTSLRRSISGSLGSRKGSQIRQLNKQARSTLGRS